MRVLCRRPVFPSLRFPLPCPCLRDTCRWGWVLRPGQIREVLAAMEFVFLLQGLPLSLPPASVKAALLVAALSIAGVPSHTKSLGHKI